MECTNYCSYCSFYGERERGKWTGESDGESEMESKGGVEGWGEKWWSERMTEVERLVVRWGERAAEMDGVEGGRERVV